MHVDSFLKGWIVQAGVGMIDVSEMANTQPLKLGACFQQVPFGLCYLSIFSLFR